MSRGPLRMILLGLAIMSSSAALTNVWQSMAIEELQEEARERNRTDNSQRQG